jgi:hypothetical protein
VFPSIWPHEDSLKKEGCTCPHAVQSRIVRTDTRAHVRAHWGHHTIPARKCPSGKYIDTYIYRIRACHNIQAGTHARTRCRRPHRWRAQSCSRAHGRDAAPCTLTAYSSEAHSAIYRDRTRLHIDTNLHTHTARSTHTRSRRRTCARTYCMSQPVIRTEADDL